VLVSRCRALFVKTIGVMKQDKYCMSNVLPFSRFIVLRTVSERQMLRHICLKYFRPCPYSNFFEKSKLDVN
jgi:hypothetical protein